MNRLYILLATVLCCLSLSAAAQRSGRSGVFTTDFNDMVFTWDGNKVSGTYDFRNGRVEGTLDGHTLTGRWTQDNAKGCLVFVFNDDFTAFTGKWSYNDAEPTSSKWDGKLKSGSGLKPDSGAGSGRKASSGNLIPAGDFSSTFNAIRFSQDGKRVTGTYDFRNGQVEGTLDGHTLTGRWTQDNAKGRLVFVFNDDFTAFTGKWSYDDAEPKGTWDGKLTAVESVSKLPAGDFSSDFNAIRFRQDGNRVTGTYDHQNGRIEGTLSGHTLTGRWTQDNGKGRFVFVFNDDFTAFTGKWSYNDAEPTSSRWDGKLK